MPNPKFANLLDRRGNAESIAKNSSTCACLEVSGIHRLFRLNKPSQPQTLRFPA